MTTSLKKYYGLLTLAALIYLVMTFTAPITSNVYNLSVLQLRVLQISLVIPIILIWTASVYGASRFRRYAELIKGTADGKGLRLISQGLLLLAFGTIVSSLVGTLQAYAREGGWLPAFVIIRNYLNIVLPLAAYWLMLKGSTLLVTLSKAEASASKLGLKLHVPYVLLASLYVYLVFQDPKRLQPVTETGTATYYLPDWLILFTIIVPYLVAWGFGIAAALNVRSYLDSVKGVIYKQALSKLSQGLAAVVVFSILIQLLSAVGTVFQDWGLGAILVLIYVIVALWAVGYIFIAQGAKKLSKIEEVK